MSSRVKQPFRRVMVLRENQSSTILYAGFLTREDDEYYFLTPCIRRWREAKHWEDHHTFRISKQGVTLTCLRAVKYKSAVKKRPIRRKK